jgi:hypothetical protein
MEGLGARAVINVVVTTGEMRDGRNKQNVVIKICLEVVN